MDISKLTEEQKAELDSKGFVFIEAMPEKQHRISKLEFMDRFIDSELDAIYTAAKTVVSVEVFIKKMELSEFINLSDERLANGLLLLEAADLIGLGRADEILGRV